VVQRITLKAKEEWKNKNNPFNLVRESGYSPNTPFRNLGTLGLQGKFYYWKEENDENGKKEWQIRIEPESEK
jgi:hypothetical protein